MADIEESYTSKAQGRYFDELLGDEEFESDLVSFFKNHDSYTLSDEEIEEVGVAQLANDFVEHMRFQDMNEYTALQDYLFVQRPEEEVDPESQLAFGRLMTALDNSEGGGTGFVEGFSDYARGFASSPSTVATAATLGTGVWTKIGAYFGKKGTQVALRKALQDKLREGVSKEVIKKQFKKGFTKDALLSRSTLATTGIDTAIGGIHSSVQGETREEVIDGYEYTNADLLRDAAIQGSLAHVVGTGAKAWDNSNYNAALDGLLEIGERSEEFTKKQRAAAFETFKNAMSTPGGSDDVSDQASSMAELVSIFEARNTGGTVDLEALPEESVKRGREIFDKMINDPGDTVITPGLSLDTIRGVTAAGIDLRQTLKKYATPGKRISKVVSDAVAAGDFKPEQLSGLRQKYGLSTDELSYLWLAEFSKAGSTLAEAKNLRKFVDSEFQELSKSGIETSSDKKMGEIIDPIIDGNTWRDIDNFTIAMMTIQTGTTAANVLSGGFRMGLVNTLDQTWDVLGKSLYGLKDGQLPDKNWLGSVLSDIKGMSWGATEVKIVDEMFKSDLPIAYEDLFYDTARIVETTGNSRTPLNTVARSLNALNTGTDAVLKQMAFYSSIDKQLRGIGEKTSGRGNIAEFLNNYSSLAELPEGVVDRAINDAKTVTFQRTYKDDKSIFGKGATSLQQLHFKVPGLVSKVFGIPFPRFVANHLETVGDYTGISHVAYGIEKGTRTLFPFMEPDNKLFDDAYKTSGDRWQRSMTGMSLMGMGAYAAFATDGEKPYDRDVFAPLTEAMLGDMDTSSQDYTRSLGTFLAPVFIGDFAARIYMGQREFKFTDADKVVLKEMLAGMAEVGFDAGIIDNIGSLVNRDGTVSRELQEFVGDQLALLTYAGKPASDIMRNAEYYRSGSPYAKDYYGGDPRLPSNFGERNFFESIATRGLAWNRAMRFVPDFGGIQGMSDDIRPGAQKDEGYYAVANYNGFSKYRTGGFSPVTSQFGVNTEAPLNELEIELNKVGLVPWQEMGAASTDRNPIVDQAKKQILSIGLKTRDGQVQEASMAEQFEVFRQKPLENLGGMTYDDISDPREKERQLRNFLSTRIKAAENAAQDVYEARMSNPDQYTRELIGYVRHVYTLEKKRLSNSKYSFDDVVKFGLQNTDVGQAYLQRGQNYESSRDFIMDVDDVKEETHRRNLLLTEWLPLFQKANKIPLEERYEIVR